MGRPVNKRFFGNPATESGEQFYIQAWFPGSTANAEEQCFIVKQTATRTFRVESVANNDQGEVRLVDRDLGAISEGEGYIEAAGTGLSEAVGAAIAGGGTGYTVDDDLTVSGGTGTAATLNVTSVSTGVIDGIEILTAGSYSAIPGNPVSVTGGTGTGATFNLTFDQLGEDYVTLLSNKNVKLFSGGKRVKYQITTGGTGSSDQVDLEGQ